MILSINFAYNKDFYEKLVNEVKKYKYNLISNEAFNEAVDWYRYTYFVDIDITTIKSIIYSISEDRFILDEKEDYLRVITW